MLGLVLSGGGARGAYQAGVFGRLAEDRRFRAPAVLSGTSAGAINAALIAAGKPPEEISRFWLELGDEPPVETDTRFFRDVTASFRRLGIHRLPSGPEALGLLRKVAHDGRPYLGSLLAHGIEFLLERRFDVVDGLLSEVKEIAVVDTRALRTRLVRAFGGETVRTGDVALAINAVETTSHRPVRFVNRLPDARSQEKYVVVDAITVDMVLASASIPIFFPPVRVPLRESTLCWDGGVLVNTPMAPAVALGATSIIPVLCSFGPGEHVPDVPSLGDAIEHLTDTLLENSYNLDRKLLLERNDVARRRPRAYREVDLYEPIRPAGTGFGAGSYLYFRRDKLSQMHDLGRQSAEAWLARGPVKDRLRRGDEAVDSAPTVPSLAGE